MRSLPVANRLHTRQKKAALTFDDGPNPHFTPEVLDVLKAEDCPAAFFMIGRWVERHPDLVRRAVREGHTVGGHSYYHGGDRGKDPYHEFVKGNEAIEKVSGIPVRYIRMPQLGYRRVDQGVPRSSELFEPTLHSKIEKGELVVIGASVATLDWVPGVPAAFNKRMALALLRPGAIVALHDGSERESQLMTRARGMLPMLPSFIREVRKRGYEFVRLDDIDLDIREKRI